MTTPAEFAHGASLLVGTDTIAKLTNIPMPEMTSDMLDATSHDSTDKFREFVKGLRDAGEFTVEGRFISEDDISTLWDYYGGENADSSVSITITLPNTAGTTFTADVYVQSLLPAQGNFEELLEFTATFKVTGKPTLTDTTS